jgi:hypothetical protein
MDVDDLPDGYDLPAANRCACDLEGMGPCPGLVLVEGELCEVCERMCSPWIERRRRAQGAVEGNP